MSDGLPVPPLADGMGVFTDARGRWVLMRNHELNATVQGPLPGGAFPEEAYRPDGRSPDGGIGVTRLVLDPRSLTRVHSNAVLAGTQRNCAGGVSPWGWLSCEESTTEGHGYVFLAPIDAEGWHPARPIRGYGRFNHEAVAIDDRHRAYLTEDRGDGCLYRFEPDAPDRPFDGRLQALAIRGRPGMDTATGLQVGDGFDVSWVDLPEPDRLQDDLRHVAAEGGAARFRRGEGVARGPDGIYFTCTTGGPVGRGQVFRLDPDRQRLTLVAQSDDPDVLDCPDNITVAPWGDLIVAEDGPGSQHLRGIRADGSIYDIARNARSSGEFAGACFSPDGRALFVNLQREGLTLAITGDLKGAAIA